MPPHRSDRDWRVLLLAAFLTIFGSGLAAQTGVRDSARMQLSQLFQTLVNEKHFNGVMFVADDSGVVFQKVSGYARLGSRKKLHAFSQFEVASVSKQFTAISILMPLWDLCRDRVYGQTRLAVYRRAH